MFQLALLMGKVLSKRSSRFAHVVFELGWRHACDIFESVIETFSGVESALPLEFLESYIAVLGEKTYGTAHSVLVDERIEILAEGVDGIGHVGAVYKHSVCNVGERHFLV